MKLVRIDAYTTALVPDDDPRAEITPKADAAPSNEPQGSEPLPADLGPYPGDKAVKRVRKP